MGGGASKKKPTQVNQPPTQRSLASPLEQPKRDATLQSRPQTPPSLSPVEEERPITSASKKKSTPVREESDDDEQPLANSQLGKPKSRSTTKIATSEDEEVDNDGRLSTHSQLGKPKSRSSTKVTTPSPIPPPNKRASTASSTTTTGSIHSSFHRVGSSSHHGELGRYCSHCPHCQRRSNAKDSIVREKTPVWLTKRPKREGLTINMDNYDVDAIQEKVIALNGHIPGSYDYQPQLTIALTKDKNESTQENYFTLPFVVKTVPGVTPACTPFPNYKLLERNERRINKPYTLPLFTD